MTVSERTVPLTAARVDGAGQLLQLIRRGEANTVSELAAALGVARSTTLQRIEVLSGSGLIRTEGATTTPAGGRGRPANVIRFRPEAGVVLSAHVGLTGFRSGVSDLGGRLLADRYDSHELSDGPEALLRTLKRSFGSLLRRARTGGDRLVGIGIGVPSGVELRGLAQARGVDVSSWDRQHFVDQLGRRYPVPVFVDLDVNCLALAEYRTSWPEAEVVVCVKLGTVIDAGIVVRGAPVRGANGQAGELGHVKISGSEALCTCGNRGCLTAVAGGAALVRQLNELGHPVTHVTEVVRLCNAGVPEAVTVVREAGRRIGEALAGVVNLLNPAAVSAWGYLTESDVVFAGIRESLYGAALPASGEGLTLSGSSLGLLAGVSGAAMRVIDEVLAPDAVDVALHSGGWSGFDRAGAEA